jgi:1,4-alpha-glucan branching enzyme
VRDLNRVISTEPAMHQVDFDWHGFEWIDCNDSDGSVLSFLRMGKNPDDLMVVVVNATPVVREGYIVGVPRDGFYKEVLNTDASAYGGSNVGNIGGQRAANDPRPGPAILALPYSPAPRRDLPQVHAGLAPGRVPESEGDFYQRSRTSDTLCCGNSSVTA